MAAVYLDADVAGLARLARLVDRETCGEASASVLAEIRQLEANFGLSPMARRRLEWEVEQATQGQGPVARSGRRDPRLHSIEGGAA